MNHESQRRSIRFQSYDYTQEGAYFVTICTSESAPPLSKVIGSGVRLTNTGRIVMQEWLNTAKLRENVQMDMHIIMPNHIHGIIWLTCQDIQRHSWTDKIESFGKPVKNSLSTIIRSFKSSVSKRIHQIQKYASINFWQRNFYEHIIRDEDDLLRVREYIMQNPAKWDEMRDATPDLWR
jgi:REP element-mobilizing transposase RayT